MRMYDIITKKKHAESLTDDEIREFIRGYTAGEIPDYQASALMMAICLNGMDDRETATLTDAMAHSGDVVDLSEFGALSVDKHSTGGVGDKTTLVVAPIVASLGCKVAKMSGRGLGHTGGTIDKLESFPGYNATLSAEHFFAQVRSTGIAVTGQSGNLAPADKKLYALRDVTATVDSIPLITSSVMSKKLASGAKNIVLDVKYGSGSFMKTAADAEILATKMVEIGKLCGRRVAALITNMDVPLGQMIGNSLEVKEAALTLEGKGPADFTEVCLSLASTILSLAYKISIDEAKTRAEEAISSGIALAKFSEWIAAQGGDTSAAHNLSLLPTAKYAYDVRTNRDGYIRHMDAEMIGIASVMLGAGRTTKGEEIDHAAGIMLRKKTGARVYRGDVIATLYTNDDKRISAAESKLLASIEYGDTANESVPLIYKTVC